MLPGWAIELWVEYAVGVLIILLRICTRTLLVGGVRGWQGDDYLIILALVKIINYYHVTVDMYF